MDPLEPSLQNILDQQSLKWIFVGGKGGVGKTTTSCSLAIQLSKVRENVLLVSTDPAHNLSDAFNQKLSSVPTLVDSFTNLYAMELDPQPDISDDAIPEALAPLKGIFKTASSSLAGRDEMFAMFEILKLAESNQFSVVVFDTAPTGHLLRFLALPHVVDKMLSQLGPLTPLMQQVMNFGGSGGDDAASGGMFGQFGNMQRMKHLLEMVKQQFADPEKTTFVCVCIAEFLSLYETERLIQELAKYNIDSHNIVVNQLIYPRADSSCEYCTARFRMQNKYLEQISELYDGDFHVIKMPLQTKEVRGVADLRAFSEMLVKPYKPS